MRLPAASLLARFSVLSLACVLALMAALGWVTSRVLVQNMQESEWQTTAELVRYEAGDHGMERIFTDPAARLDRAGIRSALGALYRLPEVVRVKVWDREAVVIWAEDERLIGQSFADNPEMVLALRGQVSVQIKSRAKPENVQEHEFFPTLAEVYVPIFAPQGPRSVIGVLEVYKVPQRLYDDIRRSRNTIWATTGLGGLLLYLSLFWVVRISHRIQIRAEAERRKAEAELPRLNQELEQRTNDRLRAADALSVSEERFQSVARSATDGIIVASGDGIVLFSNPAAQAMFGYAEDELLGRPLTLLMPERQREAYQAALDRRGATGESRPLGREVDRQGRRKDGTEFPLEMSLANWETAGRRFVSGMMRDVTERRRVEHAQAVGLAVALVLADAASLDEALARLLEAVCGGEAWDLAELWTVVEADANLLRWQGAWHRPGLDAGEFLAVSRGSTFPPGVGLPGRVLASGQPVWTADVLADPQFLRASAAATLGLHGAVGFPVRGAAPVGVLVCFSQGAPVSDDSFLSAMQDACDRIGHFIERKRAEVALHGSEKQVLQLQRLESVGRLAGGVAHDFNNLLTVILGRSRLLLARSEVDERARREITLIEQTAARAAALTKQLLAFSRQQVLEPQVLDLNGIVSGMVVMLQRLIGEDIDLAVRPGPDLGHVSVDPGQVEQVIVNLVVNARDAMPKGGQIILETANVELDADFVRRHPGAHLGSHVMLAVSDTGIGMDDEIQARVFEPFFTTKDLGKGTGLGLSTVFGIVKQSGGHISLSSAPGRGSTFTIYLPRAEARVATEGQVVYPPAGGSETILEVEDEDEVRALAREVLELSGYTVLAASGPTEALGIAERHDGPIHLILTDVVMPHMSGPQLAKDIVLLRPGIKVLYMSGYTADAIAQHGVLGPGIVLLQKPFLPDALARKVREVLDTPP